MLRRIENLGGGGFADRPTGDALANFLGRAGQRVAFLAAEGAAFTAAGQVRWQQQGGDTFVEARPSCGSGRPGWRTSPATISFHS